MLERPPKPRLTAITRGQQIASARVYRFPLPRSKASTFTAASNLLSASNTQPHAQGPVDMPHVATCASLPSSPQPITGGGAHSSRLHGRPCTSLRCGYVKASSPSRVGDRGVNLRRYRRVRDGWLHAGRSTSTHSGRRTLVCWLSMPLSSSTSSSYILRPAVLSPD
jgi:hypothetical protein